MGTPDTNPVAAFFKFAERGTNFATEARAGLTTFMVMAYIIFVNPTILGAGLKLPFQDVAAGTALVAGVMTIVMGVVGNAPFALAAGLGLNAIVAFTLPAKGLSADGAMGVIVVEGIVITILVVLGLREAIMNAVPLALKRSIGVGIGLFILFIGFVNGDLIVAPQGGVPLVGFAFPTAVPQLVFIVGLLITFGLWAMRVKAALVISILVTTAIAFVANAAAGGKAFVNDGAAFPPNLTLTPSFSTFGHPDLFQSFSTLGALAAVLTIFAIMLSDFFDTMGTVTGISAEAGLSRPDGSVPDIGRILVVDSLAAVAGGFAGVSSNTTYIESAAGVAEGGRTGFTSVVTGVLFLVAILLAPIAGIIPKEATAPALVLVGYLMFTLVKDIPVGDLEDGLPALLTMILMPLTYDITVGIGAGFISWVFLKVVKGKVAEIHPLMWAVSIAFVIYFAKDWIETILPK
jgi:AGZA family xanthine/uracil permease-like MFS transporter